MFYFLWKRKARKAMREGRTAECVICGERIIPGDFVGIGTFVGEEEERLFHAGYHNTLLQKDAFCESGAFGCGYWNGENVERVESSTTRVMRTGKSEITHY